MQHHHLDRFIKPLGLTQGEVAEKLGLNRVVVDERGDSRDRQQAS